MSTSVRPLPPAPPSAPQWSIALDLPRETRRSYFAPRGRSRDEAGSGYELSPGVLKLRLHPSSYEWSFVPAEGSTFTDSGTTDCY